MRTTQTFKSRIAHQLAAAALAAVLTGSAMSSALAITPGPAHPAAHPSAASRVPGSLGGGAGARLIAGEARLRGRGVPMAIAGFTSATQPGTRARTGVIIGVVRSIAGTPFAGACVTATGPSGSVRASSRPDGRYLLTGLRPGRYELRAGVCARVRDAGRRAAILWPRQSSVVFVRAGQIATLMPATAEGASLFRPAARRVGATARASTGSISGLVTGGGRPLRGICAQADPVNGGEVGFATTSRTGRYRITRLPAGRYLVNFASFDCAATSNWLSQWYPGINTPFQPGNAKVIKVRAGKNVPRIDGKLKLGSAIAGTVRARSGKKLGGICVTVNGAIAGGFVGIGLATGKAGSFVVHGLFPGRYQAEFMIGCGSRGNYAFQWWRGATSAEHATTIRVVGGKVVGNINPVLAPGAAVTGTVRGSDAAGPLLSGVCVNAIGDSDGNDDADSLTSRDGHYELEGLATGRYQIQFDPSCGGEQSAIYLGTVRSLGIRAGKTVSGFNANLKLGAAMSGKVTDVHGRPIDAICVLVGDGSETETNPDGTYSIFGIQPGQWSVQFAGGCGNAGSFAPQFYDNQPDGQLATLIQFSPGKRTRNIDAVMRPGGTVSGVVTNASGRRLSNICVGAATQGQAELNSGIFTDIEFTDNGHYLMQNLAPNPYLIQFGCAGGRYASQWFKSQPDLTTADLLSVNPGGTTMASARLSRAGSIAGTVTDQAGHPLSGICVSIADTRGEAFVDLPGSPALTTKAGRYTVGGLIPGRYLVQFMDCNLRVRYGSQWYKDKTKVKSATPVVIRAGRGATGISARLGIGGSISGVVTGSAGRPLGGVCVEAFDAQAEAFGQATTSRSGRYQITGLSSGRYGVFFSGCTRATQNLPSVSRPGKVRVIAPRKVTGIDIRLTPSGQKSGSISGTVTSGATPRSPLSGICVQVAPVSRNGSFGSGFTGPHGGYVVSGLAPGTYRAYFGDPFCQFFRFFGEGMLFLAPQWFSGQPTQATASDITVTAGHITGKISATLRPYGSITGTVTNHAHAGVGGECVTAVPFNNPPDLFIGLPGPPEIAISARSGHYTLADVAPGRYKVEFSTGCGDSGFATQWWNDAASPKSAIVINVGFATIGGIDAVLRR